MSLAVPKYLWVTGLLLLSGCTGYQNTIPKWPPHMEHPTLGVVSALNPIATNDRLGVTVFGNEIGPLKIDFDINQHIMDTLRAELESTHRYAVMDLPVDPKTFAEADDSKNWGSAFYPMNRQLTDYLLSAAAGKHIDFIIAVVDYKNGPRNPPIEWGLFQRHGFCASVYLTFRMLVIDARTGVWYQSVETLDYLSHRTYVAIDDIPFDQTYEQLPPPKVAEINKDLTDLVRIEIPDILMNLNLIPERMIFDDRSDARCVPQ